MKYGVFSDALPVLGFYLLPPTTSFLGEREACLRRFSNCQNYLSHPSNQLTPRHFGSLLVDLQKTAILSEHKVSEVGHELCRSNLIAE